MPPSSSAVVTGAASGLGRALAEVLGRRGHRILLVDVDEEALLVAAHELSSAGVDVESRVVDVTVRGALAGVIDDEGREHRLGYVVNNAGVGGTLPFSDATSEHWDRILDLNLRSVIEGTAAAYRVMRAQRHGHIVNTASIAGLVPVPLQTLYNTTKFAVVGLSTSLRSEAARDGVHVSAVCPGNVSTAIFGKPIVGRPDPSAAIPSDAIDPADAAATIMRGVDADDALIVFPDRARELLELYRTGGEPWERWAEARVAAAPGSSTRA